MTNFTLKKHNRTQYVTPRSQHTTTIGDICKRNQCLYKMVAKRRLQAKFYARYYQGDIFVLDHIPTKSLQSNS